MRELIKKQKYIYPIYRQIYKTTKEIFLCLLYIFIFIFCSYICMYIYNLNINNCELVTVCNTNFEELKPVVNEPNIWYKYILDDFFNKFTSNSKTVNYKVIEIKSDCVVKTLMPLEHNLGTTKKSIILNKIQSDHIKNIISECENYKNKVNLLEMQLLKVKTSYQDLIKDINDIVKEMNNSSKKQY